MMKRASQKKSPKKPRSIRGNKKNGKVPRFLDLAMRCVKNEGTKKEEFELFEHIDACIKKGDQKTLDFISHEIKARNQDLLENWKDYVQLFSSHLDGLVGKNGEELKSVLFLIPIVLAINSDLKAKDDSFCITRIVAIKESMAKAKLISTDSEDIRVLTHLFSLDEIYAIDESTKYQILKAFTYSDGISIPLKKSIFQPEQLMPGALNIKLKYIIGCATLKDGKNESPLSRFIDPHSASDSTEKKKLERDVALLQAFGEEISERMGQYLNPIPGAAIVSSAISSVYEYSSYGINSGIREFDDFKWILLLNKAMQVKNPKIKFSHPDGGPIDIALLNGHSQVHSIKAYCVFESLEEVEEYFDSLMQDLEFRGFYFEGAGEDGVVFSQRRVKKDDLSRKYLN